ncbi:serine hydrolase [Streptomyces virginiae]|uniref:serine hydrolase n=1 Tax=Streptomyces virginiae TaxID=1961 RepID=UPI00224DD5AE|nr:serine hydrolase [Streptomyces virginiae]MCX4716977.1 beta-lactamase family protein [Streptomyces virginiae]MCX5274733.1 beta-lactamase family protein [Streptomyces virginiae]
MGLVAEKAGGRPLAQQVRERLFTPLGLARPDHGPGHAAHPPRPDLHRPRPPRGLTSPRAYEWPTAAVMAWLPRRRRRLPRVGGGRHRAGRSSGSGG